MFSSLMPLCIAFVAACICLSNGGDFAFELGFLRRRDLKFDVTVVLVLCWLGLVRFGFWLVSLLAQVSHHGCT